MTKELMDYLDKITKDAFDRGYSQALKDRGEVDWVKQKVFDTNGVCVYGPSRNVWHDKK